jgi:hypothetical protein
MEQTGERRSGRLFLSFHARVKPTAQFRKGPFGHAVQPLAIVVDAPRGLRRFRAANFAGVTQCTVPVCKVVQSPIIANGEGR